MILSNSAVIKYARLKMKEVLALSLGMHIKFQLIASYFMQVLIHYSREVAMTMLSDPSLQERCDNTVHTRQPMINLKFILKTLPAPHDLNWEHSDATRRKDVSSFLFPCSDFHFYFSHFTSCPITNKTHYKLSYISHAHFISTPFRDKRGTNTSGGVILHPCRWLNKPPEAI